MHTDIKRFYISMPEDWYEALSEHAISKEKTLSQFLRDCGARRLPKEVRQGLSKPRKVGRPKLLK